MDGGGASGGAAGGGPAPFLLKTYEMVDDSNTDAIVSWSANRKSFVVWNPPEFQRVLLPSYFKHNNFSSFIRQLNTYGFRKVDPEKWEFANEDFMKDQKHLLKNIHRRKPIHSHTQPQGSVDPERAAFEEEIDKLSCERTLLEGNVSGFKEHQLAAKAQLENLTQRMGTMEQKQNRLLSFLDKAVQNPNFIEHLARKLDTMDFSVYNKKRRLPRADSVQLIHENALLDNQSTSRPEFGPISHQDLDLSDKLRLELSPAVSDVNLLSHSTQSSNEDVRVRTAGLELSDTGASFTINMDSSLSCKAGPESPKLHSLHRESLTLDIDEGEDGHISCLLNLSLASSSPLELNKSQNFVGGPLLGHEMCTGLIPNDENNEGGDRALSKDGTLRGDDDDGRNLPPSSDVRNKKQGSARVNDVFWEQFLTERPGCADTVEGSSSALRNV